MLELLGYQFDLNNNCPFLSSSPTEIFIFKISVLLLFSLLSIWLRISFKSHTCISLFGFVSYFVIRVVIFLLFKLFILIFSKTPCSLGHQMPILCDDKHGSLWCYGFPVTTAGRLWFQGAKSRGSPSLLFSLLSFSPLPS